MAVLSENPVSDQDVNWTPSAVTSHYTLIDEGMGRPITSDNVCSTIITQKELFGFSPTDNGEDITKILLRVYLGGAIFGSPYMRFRIEDPIGGGSWESASDIKPATGVYKEANETLTTNPIEGREWKFEDFLQYRIGFISTEGSGFGDICVATFQMDITTEAGGAKYSGEKIGNS